VKKFTSKSQKLGEIGESIACQFLVKHGFTILERNYTKKWGEIDIVAKKGNILHFIEVKTGVSYETPGNVSRKTKESVSYETYRPEENVHPWKLRRLFRTIETYLAEKKIGNTPWQIDIAVVKLDLLKRKGKVELIENITV